MLNYGEGALLYDKNGQRFTNELQPRDLLSQAIFEQMEKDGTDFVWEDMRPLGEKTIMQHFPNIYQHCIEEGFDPRKEPIPVVPADRKSTRLNSSHSQQSRMPSSA